MAVSLKVKDHKTPSLNLIPMMNLMAALIPFLIACSVFTVISIIDINLPAQAAPAKKGQKQKPKKKEEDLTLTVLISDQGFRIGATGGFLPDIKKTGGKYDYDELKKQLAKIKESYKEKEDIILTAEPMILYETIIKVMDICREAYFPNISIGALQ